MRELERQSSSKKVEIEFGDQIYTIKNPYREDAYELGYKLADQIYDSIRESDTDICDIAQNLGFKADNIKNVKDHVFYNIINIILIDLLLLSLSSTEDLMPIFNKP